MVNMSLRYLFLFMFLLTLWGCADALLDSFNSESSEKLFSVTFDIGKNDRVLDIEQTNDNGYIILLNNKSSSLGPNHTGGYFLLKIDQN